MALRQLVPALDAVVVHLCRFGVIGVARDGRTRKLQWRELDERTVELATPVAGERITVRLTFNQAGEITRTVVQRPPPESGNAPTPWIGDFADYRERGSVRVPIRCEVRWELPDGPLTYSRGRSHHCSFGTDVSPARRQSRAGPAFVWRQVSRSTARHTSLARISRP
jgi:Family of unknown function (DUF6544)